MIGKNFVVFVVIFIFGWGRYCECQVFFGGECLDLPTVQNFDVKRYMGDWYEYQKYPSDLDKGSKCAMETYELRDTGDVTVLKSKFNTFSKGFTETLGTAGNLNSGKVMVQFKDTALSARSRFWILDTDYDNYSVMYSCIPLTNHYHTKMVWIMTRERYPKGEALVKAFQTLARSRLPLSYLSNTDQTGCAKRFGIIDKLMEMA